MRPRSRPVTATACLATAVLAVAACASDPDEPAAESDTEPAATDSVDTARSEAPVPAGTDDTDGEIPAEGTDGDRATSGSVTSAPAGTADEGAVGSGDPASGPATSEGGSDGEDGPSARSITLVAYESFPSEGTTINERLAAFGDETGIDVEILIAGDTGTMLSKAELTAGNPEGDVMWGIDNTFLSRAVDAGIFEPYVAEGLDAIPAEFADLVPNGEATPVDFGDVCVNFDIGALEDLGVDPPETLADLADPAYRDMLVVENPATSSPGLAFLLATIDEYQDGWPDYWQQLVDNGVEVVDGWTQAYYERFSYAGGDRPLVVSYGSSPPFEVLFAETELDAAPTGVVESTCLRQIEFAGVLAGTDAPDEARMLIDFLIGEDFQAALPLDVFVFPVNENVELDAAFTDYAVIPDDSRRVEPAVVDENRSAWIDQWTDLVIG